MEKSNAVITVDRSLLKRNIEVLSERLKGADLLGVVKADAYGHGAVETARFLEPVLNAFAVNDIHEAVELRNEGIAKPILVFGVPEVNSAEAYRRHDITATISTKDHFRLLMENTSYHLNFDTGMNRLGFKPHQAKEVAYLMESHSHLTCSGIYTHFATAESPGSSMVADQEKKFRKICKYFPSDITTHISNTGGTAFYSFHNHYDMVRLGIGLYGYAPGETEIEGLQPVAKWSSHLDAVKEIQAGESVSYGATWQAPADGYLGVIPVGYEDGLKYNLSGKWSVQIESCTYEVVGSITMNYCMIYLEQDHYPVGTKVEVLNGARTARHMAQITHTIPYEILTGINRNIPRQYIG